MKRIGLNCTGLIHRGKKPEFVSEASVSSSAGVRRRKTFSRPVVNFQEIGSIKAEKTLCSALCKSSQVSLKSIFSRLVALRNTICRGVIETGHCLMPSCNEYPANDRLVKVLNAS